MTLSARSLGIVLSTYQNLRGSPEPVAIAFRSIGFKVHRVVGWVERRHGKRKRYMELNIAVDVLTREVVTMEVSSDDPPRGQSIPLGIVGGGKK